MSLKPSTIEQAKCEYSSLGKIFNKGLSEEDKKVGVFKRIKNIESEIKYRYKQIKIKEKNN